MAKVFAVIWISLIILAMAQSRMVAAEVQAFVRNGNSYIGEMKDGDFHGRGKVTLKDGTQFEGEWEDNHFVRGQVRRAEGVEFEFDGRLKFIFRRLPEQEIVGSGTARLPDGGEYFGTIDKHGHFHGEGIMMPADGRRRYGIWDRSRFVEPKSDDWRSTSFEAEGLDPVRLHELRNHILDGTYKMINSVIAVKHGKILIEEYFNGTDRFTPHDVQSVGKSFASALVGIAIDRKLIDGVDDKLLPFFPEIDKGEGWDIRKDDITLKNVLTMSYGLVGSKSNSRYEDFYNYDEDWVAGVLQTPMNFPPGSQFEYSSAASRLIAPVIARASGMPTLDFIDKYLFGPLNIDLYEFRIMPDGHPSLAGLEGMTARDLAKFGQLYLNKGRWKGRQIVSERWVEDSTASHLRVAPDATLSYGYHFWIDAYWWGENGYVRTYFASGLGGNKIFVVPSLDLVVVIASDAYGKDYSHKQVDRMMARHLIPALTQVKR